MTAPKDNWDGGNEGEVEPSDRDARLEATLAQSVRWLLDQQRHDGHWAFELEADATIPAEYILLNHFVDEVQTETEERLARYLRRIQGDHGGWPLYHDGDFDMSASVKAYYALKMVGDDVDAPHMRRARDAILAHGGAAKANVFTRITLALFGQVPWSACPVIRVEALLLPEWAPFHIDKVSYWSRTVMVPLMALCTLKPRAVNPGGVGISELFVIPPFDKQHYLINPTGHPLASALLAGDWVIAKLEPLMPRRWRDKAIAKALAFIKERLNGLDGLGGIYPAMANVLMLYHVLGYGKDHPDYRICRDAIWGLVTFHDEDKGPDQAWGYVQPCLSPVWDTGLAAHALLEAGVEPGGDALQKAFDWLLERQITDVRGDWMVKRPDAPPGGWAFQYRNDYYPDVDDTAVVALALDRADRACGTDKHRTSVELARDWVIGMQSENGGWGAFDADNETYFLQHIPFADHGALLDPPTVDVSARCLSMLAQLGFDRHHPVAKKCLDFIRDEQEEDGSWFGRWGNNYVYGTWSALCALNAIGEDMNLPHIKRAVRWLKSKQMADGGWGEDCASYWRHRKDEVKETTPSQTSWALLGLMAAGEVDSAEVERGIDYLLAHDREGGKWQEEYFNAVGFPRVFYLRYHGYSAYFPLWTLARYKNLRRANHSVTPYGL